MDPRDDHTQTVPSNQHTHPKRTSISQFGLCVKEIETETETKRDRDRDRGRDRDRVRFLALEVN